MTPQQEQTLRLQARAKGYDKAKENAYVEFVRQKEQPQDTQQPQPEQPKGDGLVKSIIKDPVKTLLVKPAVRTAQAGIALFGGEKGKQFAEKDVNVKLPFLGDFNVPAQKGGVEGEKQIAADALKTATYLAAPTIPNAGPAATTAVKVATRGAKIATGATTGYAADVATNLEQGKSGGDIFKPGLNTVVGAAIPAVGGAKEVYKATKGSLTPFKNSAKQAVIKREVDQLAKTYEEVFTGTKAAKKGFVKSTNAGKSPAKFLAERGDIIDVENGKLSTQRVMQSVKKDANALEEVFDQILQETDKQLPTDRYIALSRLGASVKSRLNTPQNRASGNLSKMNEEVDRLVNEFRQQFGDKINLSTLNLVKRGQWQQSSVFDATIPQFSKDVNYNFGKTAKELIEKNLPEADVRELNAFLGDHYDVLDNLRRVDGNAVKGGRLGGYTARVVGAVAGAKGGPIGSVIGAATGDTVAQIMQANYIASPVKRLILSRIPQTSPVYDQAQKALMTLQLGQKKLPAPKAGSLKASVNVPINQPSRVVTPGTAPFKGSGALSREDVPATERIKEFRSPLGTTFLPKVRKVAGRALDALNESTPGLSTKNVRKRTVTYTDENGKTKVLKNLSMEAAKDWTAWLQYQGLKYTVKIAGTGGVVLAVKKNQDSK